MDACFAYLEKEGIFAIAIVPNARSGGERGVRSRGQGNNHSHIRRIRPAAVWIKNPYGDVGDLAGKVDSLVRIHVHKAKGKALLLAFIEYIKLRGPLHAR